MTNQEPKSEEKNQMTFKKTLMFSLEFGFMIVLPLAIFAFAGDKLAEKYNNRVFLFGGLILALITSCIWLYKRINDIYRDYIK